MQTVFVLNGGKIGILVPSVCAPPVHVAAGKFGINL